MRDPAVDLIERAALGEQARYPLGRSDDARWPRRVDEEPGHRHVESRSKAGQCLKGRRRLVVLDLAQVPDVQPTPLCDLGQGETPVAAPVADLTAHGRALTLTRARRPRGDWRRFGRSSHIWRPPRHIDNNEYSGEHLLRAILMRLNTQVKGVPGRLVLAERLEARGADGPRRLTT